jgi:hypothetical protein
MWLVAGLAGQAAAAYTFPIVNRESDMEIEPVEKIGIARIRLSLPLCGMTAVVLGFFEADRALTAWKDAARPVHACEYAIQFTDGASLRGRFSSSAKTSRLPSLWKVVQIALGVGSAAAGLRVSHALVDRNGNTVNTSLLEHYALERL